MRLPGWIRVGGRRFRSMLFPIGDIHLHLLKLTKKTALEVGMQPEVIRRMEVLVDETCQEIGLSANIEENA